LIWFVFIQPSKFLEEKKLVVQESPIVMRVPMIILAICSLWWIVTIDPFSFSGWWLKTGDSHSITILSALWVIGASYLAFRYFKNKSAAMPETDILNTLRQTFYLDNLYDRFMGQPLMKLGEIITKVDRTVIDSVIHGAAYTQVTLAHFAGWFDRVIVDGCVEGIAWLSRGIGTMVRSTQDGLIQYYIFWAGFGLVVLLLYLIL
jgi:NADH-quinone oxidoreductase subunit L